MPKRIASSAPVDLPGKIVAMVLPKLDLEPLSEKIAQKLSEHILTHLEVDSVVRALLDKHGCAVEEALTSAIVEKCDHPSV